MCIKITCQKVIFMIIYTTVRPQMWPSSSVGLECRPVTAEIVGSSPSWVANCGNSSVVEHNLAKVGVASSSLVFRSINYVWRHSQAVRQRSAKPLSPVRFWVSPPSICRGGGTGRRKGLKIPRGEISVPVQIRSPAPLIC